ncbi:MAG TPA: amidase [Candidatus Bathyarchaeia archaeon]|nr:amidase [Candidatus Bathyarchaeia archaeon]
MAIRAGAWDGGLTRRELLRAGGILAASMTMGPLLGGCASSGGAGSSFSVEEASIAELQAAMQAGRISAVSLSELYLARIQAMDRSGPMLRAVQETNPDAPAIAAALDQERKAGRVRGPLHGIPVLIKDNIATADRMETTAGALALVGAKPRQDSTIARRLRDAGAVILGKASMSEWAYFKSAPGSSGWSARNGQSRNPYALDRSPCGSSSGSAIAVAASLATIAIGTETDGSIVCPSGVNGVVGIKPTVGLTSRAGVIPISATQDTVGPFGRTVADAATALGALVGPDPRDPATGASADHAQKDYARFLDPDGLRGARVGVPREGYFGYSPKADAGAEQAIAAMRERGAVIVDAVKIPNFDRAALTASEITVFLYEFKTGVNAYLADLAPGGRVRTLADIVEFNRQNAADNLPYFGQEWLERAQAKGGLTEPEYVEALEKCRRLAGPDGLDAAMDANRLDALVAPTTTPAWTIDLVNGDAIRGASAKSAALAGYPLISVPAGFAQGLPVGITFMGRAWSEPTLIKLAYGYEQATRARRPPQYRPTAV